MKLCITAAGDSLESPVDPRFGRCLYFIFVDSDTKEFQAIANDQSMAAGGAGIQAAQIAANHNAGAVLTGNIGPNACNALKAAGIVMVTGVAGSVNEVVDDYLRGGLETAANPSVQSHFGMKN